MGEEEETVDTGTVLLVVLMVAIVQVVFIVEKPAKQKLFLVKQEAPTVRLPPEAFPCIEKPFEMDIGYSKCSANK